MPASPTTFHSFQYSPSIQVRYGMRGETCLAVMFLGVGQSGKNLDTILASMPEGIALVEAFPYHHMPLTQMKQTSEEVAASLLDTISRGSSVHVIAESQAVPMTVGAASRSLGHVRSLILLAPLGFNKAALGDTPASRYQNIMRRSRQFWRHPNQSLTIKANRITLWEIMKHSIPAFYRIRQDYTFGVDQDVVETTKKIAEKIPIRIYADRSDSLFPYGEIEPNVKGSAMELIETTIGSHINRATPKGLDELREVLTLLRGSAR